MAIDRIGYSSTYRPQNLLGICKLRWNWIQIQKIYFLNYSALVAILIHSISNTFDSGSNLNTKLTSSHLIISFICLSFPFFFVHHFIQFIQLKVGWGFGHQFWNHSNHCYENVEWLLHLSSLLFVIFFHLHLLLMFSHWWTNGSIENYTNNEYHFNSIHIGFSFEM